MKLILVRHAESVGNRDGIIQGQKDYKLSKQGEKEAERVAKRLKNINFKAIFSSDLSRARQTAEIISEFHSGVPIHFSKILRERHIGYLQGKKIAEIKDLEKIRERYKTRRPKGGETYGEVKKRAKKFLDNLLKKYPKDTILIVTHGGFIRMLWSAVASEPIKKTFEKEIFLHNTCVNEIEVLPDRSYKIIRINCIKHLDK